MKIVEKTKEFVKEHKKAFKNTGIIIAGGAVAAGGYLLGVRDTNRSWSNTLNRAAFGDGARMTYGPTGDKYLMTLTKVVEEVAEA